MVLTATPPYHKHLSFGFMGYQAVDKLRSSGVTLMMANAGVAAPAVVDLLIGDASSARTT